MLSAAAVVGREFDLSLVEPASDLAGERMLDSLSEAVALGVVVEDDGTGSGYRFSHSLIREVLYERLPIPVRMQLHRRVGEAIERLYGSGTGAHVAELARHFAEVAAVGDADKALIYARLAGERALAMHAYEEAAAEYQRALSALKFAGPDELERCELLLQLGSAQARAGNYQQAQESCLQAAEISRRLGAPEQLARAALGLGERQVEGGLANQQLVALLQEALVGLSPQDSPLRARLLARLSLEFVFSDETELTESFSREAVTMARRLADPLALRTALDTRWMALWGPDGLEERTALADEILRRARDTNHREMELDGHAQRAASPLESGDGKGVQADIAAHARRAEELPVAIHRWAATTMGVLQALLRGSFDDGERLADEALSLQPGRPNVMFTHLVQIALLRWEQGRLEELRDQLRGVVERFPRAAFARAWLSLAAAEAGELDEARSGLRSLAEQLPTQPRDGIWLPAVALASVLSVRLNEPEGCSRPVLAPNSLRGARCRLHRAPARRLLRVGVVLSGTAGHLDGPVDGRLTTTSTTQSESMSGLRPGRSWRGPAMNTPACCWLGVKVRTGIGRWGYWIGACHSRHPGDGCGRRGIRTIQAAQADGTVAVGPAAPTAAEPELSRNLFRREGEYWTVAYDGSVVRLRDAKGLRHLAQLLAHPGREFLAIDLEAADPLAAPSMARVARGSERELTVRPDLGDAGVLLDATAKAAYQTRIKELRAELDEADFGNDLARATNARAELDFLVAELARAVGLGGRDRRAASHAERARLNVTRAIRAAMVNLARGNPSLGRHLDATIRTGRYCSYTPNPRAPISCDR